MRATRRDRRRHFGAPSMGLECLEGRILLSGNVTATVTGAGNLLIRGDAHANQVSIQSSSTALVISSLDATTTINGGTGPFNATGVTGNVFVSLGQGNDVLQIGGGTPTTVIPHDLLVLVGNGQDSVSIENSSIGGNVSIIGGNGGDTFSVGSTSETAAVTIGGNLLLVGGCGSDTLAVFDASICGNLTIAGGGGNDQIQVGFDAGLGIIGSDETATGHVDVDGNLQITDGLLPFESGNPFFWNWGSFFSCNGSQTVSDLARSGCFKDSWFSCWGSDHNSGNNEHIAIADVVIDGNLRVQTGSGSDEVLIGAAHTPATDTNPFLNLVFGQVSVGGDMDVHTGDGNDTLLVVGVSVTDNTTIGTGKGIDHIAILEGTGGFSGNFTLTTGNGNDDIVLADSNAFLGTVTIHCGAGSDTLWLAGNEFQGPVNLNGGPGSDTFMQSMSLFPNDFAGGAPTITSFEISLPDVAPTDAAVVAAFGWLDGLLGL